MSVKPGPPGDRSMTRRQWGLLLSLAIIWGSSFFFGRIAVAEIPPLSLVFLRVVIAALVLNTYLAFRGTPLSRLFHLTWPFAVLSIINNIIPFTLIFLGQTEIGAGLASVINGTTPFWTILLASFLTADERLSATRLTGVVIGIAGTAIMVGPDLLSGLGAPWWAKLCGLGAAMSYGLAGIYAKRFAGTEPVAVATSQLTWSSILVLPLMILVDGPGAFISASMEAYLSVLALAVLCTAFAYILFFTLIASAGASNTSLVTLIVPVSALILGIVFLGEILTVLELAGMVLIAIGLLVIDGRLRFRRAPRTDKSE